MRIAAVLIVVLALVIGVVPQFTDCQSQGRALTLPNGKTVPMKCHWTGIAEIAMAVPLAALGGMMAVSRRKETKRMLAIMGATLGILVILLPATLIGVCASADMLCNSVMKPTLILSGILVVAVSLVSLVVSERAAENIS